MKNVRGMNIQVGKDAKIVVGGKRVRSDDGSRFTSPPLDLKRSRRRAANRRARASRRANR